MCPKFNSHVVNAVTTTNTRCSVVHPFPSSLSHTFRDEEINSDVVLAGLFDDDGNERTNERRFSLIGRRRRDGKITLESEAHDASMTREQKDVDIALHWPLSSPRTDLSSPLLSPRGH